MAVEAEIAIRIRIGDHKLVLSSLQLHGQDFYLTFPCKDSGLSYHGRATKNKYCKNKVIHLVKKLVND